MRGKQFKRFVQFDENNEISIKDAAEEFYSANKAKNLSIRTQASYKMFVGQFMDFVGSETLLQEITPKTLDKYILKKEKDGNKPISIASNLRHIRRFINFCYERGYTVNVDVVIPRYEEEVKDPYTDEEMQKLLKRPTGHNWVEYRNWVMVNYFFGTGQRISTVVNIKVSDLDLDNSIVKLRWNKDKKPKNMPLSSGLVKILREYIVMSDLKEQDYLFPEYEGYQLKIRSAQDSIAQYNHSRGVERTSIHLFRHTFAKHFIMNGGSPAKLQKLLNHKTIDMTMKYVNLYANDLATDLERCSPLDTFKRSNYTPRKRKRI